MGPEAVGIPFGRILTSHLRGASVAFRVGAEEPLEQSPSSPPPRAPPGRAPPIPG